MADDHKPKHPWIRRVVIGLAVLIALCIGGFALYASDYSHAGERANTLISGGTDENGTVITTDDASIAIGDPVSDYGIVFYPGAKVAPETYTPLACKLADHGVHCVIAKMPFDFAFFNIGAADKLMAQAPQVKHWWIAGHSLGGAMASQYAADNASKLESIALLGAYAASDLSATNLKALVIYGENDGVLNREKLTSDEGNLPADAKTIVIPGGNHVSFGDYGTQDDDKATISADSQQQQTADAILAMMQLEQSVALPQAQQGKNHLEDEDSGQRCRVKHQGLAQPLVTTRITARLGSAIRILAIHDYGASVRSLF